MIEIKDIEKLANLARLELAVEEKEDLRKKIDSILSYVDEIKKASLVADVPSHTLINVFREDGDPHLPGEFTADILREVPMKENGFIKVKKILKGHDRA